MFKESSFERVYVDLILVELTEQKGAVQTSLHIKMSIVLTNEGIQGLEPQRRSRVGRELGWAITVSI
jgi:hypothetical protein